VQLRVSVPPWLIFSKDHSFKKLTTEARRHRGPLRKVQQDIIGETRCGSTSSATGTSGFNLLIPLNLVVIFKSPVEKQQQDEISELLASAVKANHTKV